MQNKYPVSSRVSVKIAQAIPPGLLGQVENGPRAIVRNREISWGKAQPVEWYLGKTLTAVVVGYDSYYKQLELSLRLIEEDPWDDVGDKYRRGRRVEGRVVGLVRSGAFVELKPGVDGFLPANELPIDRSQPIEDYLWIDDYMLVQVAEVDTQARRLALSMRPLLSQRFNAYHRQLWRAKKKSYSPQVTLAEVLPNQVRLGLLRLHHHAQELEQRSLQVLLLEDDLSYGSGLEDFLRRNACRVTWVQDGVTGLEKAQSQETAFDLIIIDRRLPGISGDQVLEQLKGHSLRAVMIVNPGLFENIDSPALELFYQGIEVFSKADTEACQAGLLAVFRDIRQNSSVHSPVYDHRVSAAPSPERVSPSSGEEEAAPPLQSLENLDAFLRQVAKDTGATTVALLRLERGQMRPSAEACVGMHFSLEDAAPDVIYSPLADVLKEGQEVHNHGHPMSPRFDRLQKLLTFEGFLGIPIPQGESFRYGLILFKKHGQFDRSQRRVARLAVYPIAGKLQEQRLTRVLRPWQAQSLVGQLTSAIVHEVNNKLGGIKYHSDNLCEMLGDLERHPEKANDPVFLSQLRRSLEEIASAQSAAANLRNQYLRLASSDSPELVDLGELVVEIVRVLGPEAKNANISLIHRASEEPLLVKARPSQLKQVLLNLMLNAVQQMVQLGRQGTVMVRASYKPDEALPVQLHIKDEGPGIHFRRWERIFDFGFTTKKDGAGLGLTISRRIIRELGGELDVEESHMLWGTTFLLALPVGEDHG